ncbi:MAG: hypothetical protein PVF45_07035 [Anaerolineae bacterium]|jgi:hypothetical protein
MAHLESAMWYIVLVEAVLILGVCIAFQITRREKEEKRIRDLLAGKLDEWVAIYEETGNLPSQTDSIALLKLWSDFNSSEREL